MNREERIQMYVDYLREEGYAPNPGEAGVVFKMEGRSYIIIVDAEDEQFFRIVFPNFWPIQSEEDRQKVRLAAIKATMETKGGKVYPVENDVWASIELFFPSPEQFKPLFQRAISVLNSAVNTFVTTMRANS